MDLASPASEVMKSPAGVGEPVRLNLGGAGEGFLSGRIPGFLTVDLREGPDTDIVGNVSDLGRFADGSVDAIYASNVLEHFSLQKTVGVLREWGRVLKKGSPLYISVPDFEATVKLYQKIGLVEWINYHLMGDQKHELNYHYSLFTFGKLANDLMKADFSDVKKMAEWPFEVKDGSQNRNNFDGQLISLNVVATK